MLCSVLPEREKKKPMQQHCCDCRLTFIITEQRVAAQVTLRTGSRRMSWGRSRLLCHFLQWSFPQSMALNSEMF
uniref:Uncharacterized protein n=1 Tax=Anguilla anguilla TaxID=7936 RepID=A0A0E9WK27_ANGAN